jgi:hypothetical protein
MRNVRFAFAMDGRRQIANNYFSMADFFQVSDNLTSCKKLVKKRVEFVN